MGRPGPGSRWFGMDGTSEVGKSSIFQVGATCGGNYSNWMNKHDDSKQYTNIYYVNI